MSTVLKTMNMICAIRNAAQIKTGRNFADFFADRLVIAGTESSLLAFFEKLQKSLDCDVTFIGGDVAAGALSASAAPDAYAMLSWIREYPKVIAMITGLKNEADYNEALKAVVLSSSQETGSAISRGEFDVDVTARCLAPFAHGGDNKAGNATLFRRCQVLSTTGTILTLPFYAGNSLRGQMRDALADHFLTALGIAPRRDKPAVSLWFFHALYAGGALSDSKQTKAIGKRLGDAGAVKAEGVHEFRKTLPTLSALGCALGNRIMSGSVCFADLVPDCKEWGSGTTPAAELMEWTFLTRREDHEGHAEQENSSMIANSECLRMGTMLRGGLTFSGHITDVERSAIGKGLLLLKQHGHLGAENRRGLGKVEINLTGAPDAELYERHLRDNKDAIITYLKEINAIPTQQEEGSKDARDDADSASAMDEF